MTVTSLPGGHLVSVCAYNEAESLPELLKSLSKYEVLIVDDGSIDGTRQIVSKFTRRLLIHSHRMGYTSAMQDALNYAKRKGFLILVEIDADALPSADVVEKLVSALATEGVGGASGWQIPVGPRGLAFKIDELMWSLLNYGKVVQMERNDSCYLGGVTHAFKVDSVKELRGAINADEQIGYWLHLRKLRTVLVKDAVVYFDASSSVGHLIERRKRMILGHTMYKSSEAPSMHLMVSTLALMKSLKEKPSRVFSVIPALVVESIARLQAFRESRNPVAIQGYRTWVTRHAKTKKISQFLKKQPTRVPKSL
jgi:glycosyltransferase involved in cell wall biosynthesis